jgi:trimeric autotransporter adhesin
MRTFRPALPPGALAAGLVLLLGTSAGAQSDILLQLESGSPAGDRFVVDSAGGFVARGTFNRGTIPATGAGVRLMWYPRKVAFRVGRVTGSQWDDASVGVYSVATGYNTTASGFASTATGRGTTASGDYSTAMGDGTTASGFASTATGVVTTASGLSSTAMGYQTTASGSYSTAMGNRAVSGHHGSFVYGDLSGTLSDTVRSSADDQATWRTSGGFRIYTNSALSAGVTLAAGGGTWNSVSDRNRKEAFAEVDGEGLLARIRRVPVTSWRYIAEEDRAVRHIGPMAQDWAAAFPELGGDGTTINSGDLDGVNLAAVQALDGRTRGVPEMEERIRQLEAENAAVTREAASLRREASEQRARLERLERLVAALVTEP